MSTQPPEHGFDHRPTPPPPLFRGGTFTQRCNQCLTVLHYEDGKVTEGCRHHPVEQ